MYIQGGTKVGLQFQVSLFLYYLLIVVLLSIQTTVNLLLPHLVHMFVQLLRAQASNWASGQDGSIGRYALLLHTTKIRIIINLKRKNN